MYYEISYNTDTGNSKSYTYNSGGVKRERLGLVLSSLICTSTKSNLSVFSDQQQIFRILITVCLKTSLTNTIGE